MDTTRQDLRYAFRTLVRRPGFTLTAVAILALGIGATTSVFSLANGLLFRGVPGLTDTEGLVEISRDLDGRHIDISFPVFRDLRAANEVLEDMVAQVATPIALGDENTPSVHLGLAVTGNYFSILRLQPQRGRFWAAEESFHPRVTPTVIISDFLWNQRFGRREDVVGQVVRINGYPVEVIGVAPTEFAGHGAAARIDLFVPLGLDIPGLPRLETLDDFQSGIVEVFGRLNDGVTTREAAAVLTTVADQMNRELSETAEVGGYVVQVASWGPLPSSIRAAATAFFTVLLVVVGLALAMACLNVSNMMLARATERGREVAVRQALGAGRRRLVRQLLTESLLLFALAGAAGVLLAAWATRLLLTFRPPLPPGVRVALDLVLDWRVLGFALMVTCTSGLVFGLAPALHGTNTNLVPALKEGGTTGATRRSRLRGIMVGIQMAVTVLLLVVAGLFTRALTHMKQLDPGWQADGVQVMSLDLELSGTPEAEGRILFQSLNERIGALPGVEAAGMASKLPLAGSSSMGQISVEGVQAPEDQFGYDAFYNRVSAGYFAALRIPILQGRDVSDTDTEEQPRVAVVNRAMAQRFWPNGSPVGQEFWVGQPGNGRAYRIIGVVENTKYRRLVEETPNFFYVPYQQRYNAQMTLHVRATPGAESTIARALPEFLRELAPGIPRLPVRSLNEEMQLFFLPQRLAAWVAGTMGLFGLLLGALGVYGVTAFVVGQRTREIGIRLAIGASAQAVTSQMVRRALIAPVVGMCVGLLVAFSVTRSLTSMLAGVSPTDPAAFGGVALVLGGVALIATILPVRRASRIDPAVTLRAD